jgi:hypothetical protein
MRSNPNPQSAALAANLYTELKARGIRGAYAKRLVTEWLDHFRNLTESMPETEALARLGVPAELAQAAARERFEKHWWWRWPVSFGIAWGLIAYLVVLGWVVLPVIASLNGLVPITQFTWYEPAFNWAGPLLLFFLVWWLSDKVSSPPPFRTSMIIVFGVLLSFTVMNIQVPEGYIPGSGTGLFSLGLTVYPGSEVHPISYAPWLVACRLLLLLSLFFWSRRSILRAQ